MREASKMFKSVKHKSSPDSHHATENECIDSLYMKLLGHAGRYQILVILCFLPVKLSEGWHLMVTVFITRPIDFRCVSFSSNFSFEAENNTCYGDCMRYNYDRSVFNNNVIMQWDLICERKWMASLPQTLLMFGVLIGNTLFGIISDRWGRRAASLIAVVGLVTFSFATPFTSKYAAYAAFRFMIGIFIGGDMIVTFILSIELIGSKYRELMGFVNHVPVLIGYATLAVFGYYLRSWDSLLFGIAVPSFYYLIYFWVLPESPRWLISVGKFEEAKELIQTISKRNRRPAQDIEALMKPLQDKFKQSIPHTSSIKDLFEEDLKYKMLYSMGLWFACGFGFFGTFQYLSHVTPEIFVSVGTAAAIQLPAKIVTAYCLKRFGRKTTIIAGFWVGSLCTLGLTFDYSAFWYLLLAGTIAVSGFSSVYLSMYVYSSELFPTVARNMAVGLCSTAAKVGAMIAPFIASYCEEDLYWIPPVLFAFVPVTLSFLCFLLPETKGKELKDTFQS